MPFGHCKLDSLWLLGSFSALVLYMHSSQIVMAIDWPECTLRRLWLFMNFHELCEHLCDVKRCVEGSVDHTMLQRRLIICVPLTAVIKLILCEHILLPNAIALVTIAKAWLTLLAVHTCSSAGRSPYHKAYGFNCLPIAQQFGLVKLRWHIASLGGPPKSLDCHGWVRAWSIHSVRLPATARSLCVC